MLVAFSSASLVAAFWQTTKRVMAADTDRRKIVVRNLPPTATDTDVLAALGDLAGRVTLLQHHTGCVPRKGSGGVLLPAWCTLAAPATAVEKIAAALDGRRFPGAVRGEPLPSVENAPLQSTALTTDKAKPLHERGDITDERAGKIFESDDYKDYVAGLEAAATKSSAAANASSLEEWVAAREKAAAAPAKTRLVEALLAHLYFGKPMKPGEYAEAARRGGGKPGKYKDLERDGKAERRLTRKEKKEQKDTKRAAKEAAKAAKKADKKAAKKADKKASKKAEKDGTVAASPEKRTEEEKAANRAAAKERKKEKLKAKKAELKAASKKAAAAPEGPAPVDAPAADADAEKKAAAKAKRKAKEKRKKEEAKDASARLKAASAAEAGPVSPAAPPEKKNTFTVTSTRAAPKAERHADPDAAPRPPASAGGKKVLLLRRSVAPQ